MHDNFASPSPASNEKEELGFLSPLVLNIAKNEKVSFEEFKFLRVQVYRVVLQKRIYSYI